MHDDINDPVRLELAKMLTLMERRNEIDDQIHEKRQAVQKKLKLGVGESKQYIVGKYAVKVKQTIDGPYAYELTTIV